MCYVFKLHLQSLNRQLDKEEEENFSDVNGQNEIQNDNNEEDERDPKEMEEEFRPDNNLGDEVTPKDESEEEEMPNEEPVQANPLHGPMLLNTYETFRA